MPKNCHSHKILQNVGSLEVSLKSKKQKTFLLLFKDWGNREESISRVSSSGLKYKNNTVGRQNLARRPRAAPHPAARVAPSRARALTVSPRLPWTPLHCEGTDATPRVSSCSGPGRPGPSALAAPPVASATAAPLPAEQSGPGCAGVAVETAPPSRAVALQRDRRARGSRAEDWGPEAVGAIFESVRDLLQNMGHGNKFFFPAGPTRLTSLGHTVPRSGPLGACAPLREEGTGGRPWLCAPGSKMAPRGAEARAGGGGRQATGAS